MTKREISVILAGASQKEIIEIAAAIQESCEIQIMKPPQKTLVMVKARESVKKSLFYLGEVLASECMVLVDSAKGAAVLAGDDFDKVTAAAVIDGFLNLPDKKAEKEQVLGQIQKLGRQQVAERAKLNRALRKSKVNFNVMGE
ncbi:phosphonate C-P lyase system protein PhnG [Muricomes sp. OA1]|uniref:Phosphonate C-P lyase system protein PhnG n=1 Tax=Hungatella hathewayi TaxID=154046 RepID=A0A3E2WYE1_9FIRM|nr:MULTISPECIES: phosphonate C-P lyase system protein PhnG [Clostridia]MCH1972997.1 phosphonate C-P lyase system protein PhnG [Muricomes sp. OA1]RGC33334.1 phosphonate C-P lyase system protein PhnG [Hungatella hathewayi]GKH31771.1 hypothetical protein CE91St64_11780 [Faecalicatena contorta]